MSPRLYWRRLLAAYRRQRGRRRQRALAFRPGKPQLAAELLETLTPHVLFEAGYLRRRVVRRRRFAYVRMRAPR